jgi:hypothetical protein
MPFLFLYAQGLYALQLSLGINQEICRGDNLLTRFDSTQHFHSAVCPEAKLDLARFKDAFSFIHIDYLRCAGINNG